MSKFGDSPEQNSVQEEQRRKDEKRRAEEKRIQSDIASTESVVPGPGEPGYNPNQPGRHVGQPKPGDAGYLKGKTAEDWKKTPEKIPEDHSKDQTMGPVKGWKDDANKADDANQNRVGQPGWKKDSDYDVNRDGQSGWKKDSDYDVNRDGQSGWKKDSDDGHRDGRRGGRLVQPGEPGYDANRPTYTNDHDGHDGRGRDRLVLPGEPGKVGYDPLRPTYTKDRLPGLRKDPVQPVLPGPGEPGYNANLPGLHPGLPGQVPLPTPAVGAAPRAFPGMPGHKVGDPLPGEEGYVLPPNEVPTRDRST